MKTITYKIKDELGIHARPAGLLVKKASSFSSDIKISKGEKNADLKKLFAVMSLGVKKDDEITISASGSDEEKAVSEIEKFLSENL